LRRALIAFVIALAGVLIGASPAWAEEGEALRGTLTHEGSPVAGVSISVYTEDGDLIETVTTGADGTWRVVVPGPGVYRVDLDESTLPPGLVVRNGRPSLTPEVFRGNERNVIFPLGTGVSGGGGADPAQTAGPTTPGGGEQPAPQPSRPGLSSQVVNLAYSGVHFGLIIALAALGLSLVFGTTGLTNFAHGELVTFGAVMAFLLNVTIGLPLLLAAFLAIVLGGVFGYAQDRWFWGWLRRRGTGLIAMMIISIGVALMLRFLYLYFIGGETRRYTEYVIQQPYVIGPLTVTPKSLVSDAIALVVLVAVSLALVYTRLGTATRAVADNPSLAASSGVPVNRIVRLVWSVGAALAALAGVILAVDQGVSYQLGLEILLLVFSAVVLGGLGTAFGALFGALIIGLFIQLSTLWVPAELKYLGALVALIVILLVRPQGLLGRRERIG
jgi:Branched-chain amino acid ABC-type transport system, permease components